MKVLSINRPMKTTFVFVIKLFLTPAVLVMAVCCSSAKDNPTPGPKPVPDGTGELTLVRIDPTVKVFKENKFFDPYSDAEEAARGETVSFQFVLTGSDALTGVKIEPGNLKCGASSIPYTLKARERYVTAGLHLAPAGSDSVFPASDQYPDCLDEAETFDLAAGENLPLWVSYTIPTGVEAGDYVSEITVSGVTASGETQTATCGIAAKVYDVTLGEQSLYISNWYDYTTIPLMAQGEVCKKFTEPFYDMFKEMVHVMRDHGQNVYWLHPLSDFAVATRTSDGYTFDFTRFDRMVQICIDEGNLKRIEGGELARRSGDWDSDYWVHIPDKNTSVPLSNGDAQLYLRSLIPALKKHLQEKGWWDIYYQHIGDEPSAGPALSYVRIAEMVKNIAPDLKVLEAVHTCALADMVDVWCPELDFFQQDWEFYRTRPEAGDELWFYTCMAPRGEFANRFLEQPLIKTRLLHWINFKYGATGYLHWGFNQDWMSAMKWMATEGYCPGGDTYIVYPGHGKPYSSIRLEAMRDGINDYELLHMLEAVNPSMAHGLVDSIVFDFEHYNTDINTMRTVRRSILQYLQDNK